MIRYDIRTDHDFTFWIDQPGQYVTYTIDDDGELAVSTNGNAYRTREA